MTAQILRIAPHLSSTSSFVHLHSHLHALPFAPTSLTFGNGGVRKGTDVIVG
jgi:hypothetical protein